MLLLLHLWTSWRYTNAVIIIIAENWFNCITAVDNQTQITKKYNETNHNKDKYYKHYHNNAAVCNPVTKYQLQNWQQLLQNQ